MTKHYSPSTGGFYDPEIHDEGRIPTDCVEISDEEWQALLNEQARGKEIREGTHGRPIAVERKLIRNALVERDRALGETDWLVARHRDEKDLSPGQTTLSHEQYVALQAWRRALRDLSSHPDWPNVELPVRPA